MKVCTRQYLIRCVSSLFVLWNRWGILFHQVWWQHVAFGISQTKKGGRKTEGVGQNERWSKGDKIVWDGKPTLDRVFFFAQAYTRPHPLICKINMKRSNDLRKRWDVVVCSRMFLLPNGEIFTKLKERRHSWSKHGCQVGMAKRVKRAPIPDRVDDTDVFSLHFESMKDM